MNKSPFSAYWDMDIHPTKKLIMDSIKSNTMFVAEEEEIIGAMVLDTNGTMNYEKAPWKIKVKKEEALVLHLLAISPYKRGKGIGMHMVQNAIEQAERKRIKTLRLDVIATNLPAIKLYEKNRFIKIEDYKEEISEREHLDFVLYERILK